MARQKGLSDQMAAAERKALKDALTASGGNIRAAAEQLGIGQSTMQGKVRRIYPELGRYADKLKKRQGHSTLGRPADRSGTLSKRRVKAAYRKHKTIAATARALDRPAATVRNVLIEYGLYTLATEAE